MDMAIRLTLHYYDFSKIRLRFRKNKDGVRLGLSCSSILMWVCAQANLVDMV